MIPDVRVMMVALFASIVAISSGLGLFAAFRVNHEQFAGARNGSPLLEMAFAVPASVADAPPASVADRSRMDMPTASIDAADAAAIRPNDAAAEPEIAAAAVEPTTAPAAAVSAAGQETPQAGARDGTGDIASPVDQSPPAGPTVQDANAAPLAPSVEPAPSAKAAKKTTRYRAGRMHHPVPSQAAAAAAPADQPAALPQPALPSGRKPPRSKSSGVTFWSSEDPQ
jgi:hypothetical protein